MTRPVLVAVFVASWAAATAGWWATHRSEGLGSALIVVSLVGVFAALVARVIQATAAREARLQHDLAHAELDRELQGCRDNAERGRIAATIAAAERASDVKDLKQWRDDHVRRHDVRVPGQRKDDG